MPILNNLLGHYYNKVKETQWLYTLVDFLMKNNNTTLYIVVFENNTKEACSSGLVLWNHQ